MDSITTRRFSPDREVEKASWAAIRELCCRTGDNGQAIAKERWDFFPRIWIDPYERLVPQWTYVAVVQEAIVGYLTGCPDSRKFSRSKAWCFTFPCWCRLASVDITTLPALVNLPGTEATDLKRAVLLQQGKTLSEQNKLTDSFAALTQLAKLSPKDSAVSSLLGNVRGRLVQQHYNQGIRLYREKN